MPESNYEHTTSTFRTVSQIILSRFHIHLKSSIVVIKGISITGIISRTPCKQENIKHAIASVPKLNPFKVTLYNSALLSMLLGNQEGAWVRMHLLSTGTSAPAETPGVLVPSQVAFGCRSIPWMPLNTNFSANSRAAFGHHLLWADWGCCTILDLCEINLDIFT